MKWVGDNNVHNFERLVKSLLIDKINTMTPKNITLEYYRWFDRGKQRILDSLM
jgi:hypothetical protein